MAESLVFGREMPLVVLQRFTATGIDGQGAPLYDLGEDFRAVVVERTKFTPNGDGSKLRTDLTVYVPGSEPRLEAQDVLEWEGRRYVVELRRQVRSVDQTLVHTVYECSTV